MRRAAAASREGNTKKKTRKAEISEKGDSMTADGLPLANLILWKSNYDQPKREQTRKTFILFISGAERERAILFPNRSFYSIAFRSAQIHFEEKKMTNLIFFFHFILLYPSNLNEFSVLHLPQAGHSIGRIAVE